MPKLVVPDTDWNKLQSDLLRIGGRGNSTAYPSQLLVEMELVEREPRKESPGAPIDETSPTWLKVLAAVGEFTMEASRKWRLTDEGKELYSALFVDEDESAIGIILRHAAQRLPVVYLVTSRFSGKGWVKESRLQSLFDIEGLSVPSDRVHGFVELLWGLRVVEINRRARTFSVVDQEHSTLDEVSTVRQMDSEIEKIELALRRVIIAAAMDEMTKLPSHVVARLRERAQETLKRHPELDRGTYSSLAKMLELSDLRDLEQILVSKTLWPRFEVLFSTKEQLAKRFEGLAEARNCIRHSLHYGRHRT